MKQTSDTQTPPGMEERIQRLQKLDFASIRQMLGLAAPTGFGWSEETALEAEGLYRQFLHLNLVGAAERPVPNVLVDAFWHAHILDTKKYREDCQHVFGYFLDHNPGFGANGDADERDHAFEETVEANKILFGKRSDASMCGSSASMCGSSASMCGSSIHALPRRMQVASMCGSSIARS